MTEPQRDGEPRSFRLDAGFWSRLRQSKPSAVQDTLVSFELPDELNTFVKTIVSSTRLWRSEQVDVAKELAGHFRDGLDSGASTEHLIKRFGDVTQAAKMIRQARKRCRPLYWQVGHYGFRAALILFGVVLLFYSALAIRYFTSSPTVTRLYFDEINSAAKEIPEADRAWPFYREAILLLQQIPEDEERHWWNNGEAPPAIDAPQWHDLETHIDANRDAIAMIHKGAKYPHMGYVYGDPENLKFLDQKLSVDSTDLPKPGQTMFHILLPQTQEMRSLARLLQADSLLAAARGEGERTSNDLQSMISLASHARGNGFIIEDLVAYAIFSIAMARTTDILYEQPDLLSSEQLVDLAHRFSSFAGGGALRPPMRLERWAFDDFLQRSFSDDGTGDGRLTPEGHRLLDELGGPVRKLSDQSATPISSDTLTTVLGPGLMAFVGTRNENYDLAMKLFDRSVAESSDPYYTWKESSVDDELRRLNQSLMTKMRYLPVRLFLPAMQQAAAAGERVSQTRDGLLTAIALELFHRREGKWPDTLNELVPRYIPEVPLDRVVGEPIQYIVRDDRPVVYSVGMDRQNDGGRMPPDHEQWVETFTWRSVDDTSKPKRPIREGYDWMLFPRYREPYKEPNSEE
ncbi:MAG: hypothetical protein O2955_16635 [Planctomycetota bacterium]|nr:hypothetical protein [Planctomycetota bacterium]